MPVTESVREVVPHLESGDHLDREEFHRRYEARTDDRKVELIGGVVYVSSPVRVPHSEDVPLLAAWLDRYAEATPHVQPLSDPSLLLGPEDEPQPDVLLRLTKGGSSTVDEKEYLWGPVELVLEVAHSTVALDLHEKKACYERHGCQEYAVACVREREVRWFTLADGVYAPLPPAADGALRSRVFPGLWLDPRALFALDRPRLVEVLRQGLATPEHAAFVARLRQA